MRPAEGALPVRHAVVLGLVQGPAELLPISSSAHTALIPWLAGWQYERLAAHERKSFEVALHAGGALALALAMRAQLARSSAQLDRRRVAVAALSLAPPALAGIALRGPIERRLGGPRSIAAGLVAGAAAMALADARPGAVRGVRGARAEDDARPLDGLVLGCAQALALIPGVSRSGATLAASRALGFARADAWRLSYEASLPVVLGAGALEALRLARGGSRGRLRTAAAAGALASALSTAASARVLARPGAGRALAPYALYRCALAALVVRRARRGGAARTMERR